MRPFSVVLLAAGGSSRLGRPKQLVPYSGTTLVAHAARSALSSGALEVIVVVGASAEAVARALEGQPVKIVNNSDWQTGLGSSIAAGVGAVSDAAEACVLMLCDQPAITSEHLRALVKKYETEKESCVVTAFADTFGPPAVFARSMFPDLLSIPGDQGARAILREMADLPSIRFDAAAIDIDDPEDLQALTSGSANGNSDDD